MKLIPFTLCFFIGVLVFQQCKTLPNLEVFIFMPGLIYGAYISKFCHPCLIFSAGVHNRYRHPHPRIVDRFSKRDIHTLSTAVNGAISFQLYPNEAIQLPISYQQQSKRYWHSSRKQL